MENREIEIKGKGIKVSIVSHVFIVIGVIAMVAALVSINKIYTTYDEMMDAYQFEEIESTAATSFKTASDYLTDQARQFAVTGDVKSADNYFEEKDIIKRREAALETVGSSKVLNLETNLLSNAMELSEALVEDEVHAMKLTAQAKKIDESLLPDEVATYELTNEELELDAIAMQDLAIQLLYSSKYEEYKDKINWDVVNATTLIKDESGTRFREDESALFMVLNITTSFVFLMFIILVSIFILFTLLMVKPARKFVELLDKGEKLPEIGGYEFRKFARRYNEEK